MVDAIPTTAGRAADRAIETVRDTSVHAAADGTADGTADVAADVADLLQAVAHRLRRESRAGAPDDVSWAQLRALRTLGRNGVPTRMSRLADDLHIARRSATSLVDELEARGLVARGHDPGDRRAVTVEVTVAGHELLAAMGERRRQTAVGMLGVLPATDLHTLRDLLGRVVA